MCMCVYAKKKLCLYTLPPFFSTHCIPFNTLHPLSTHSYVTLRLLGQGPETSTCLAARNWVRWPSD